MKMRRRNKPGFILLNAYFNVQEPISDSGSTASHNLQAKEVELFPIKDYILYYFALVTVQ